MAETGRERWTSRPAFIMAAVGSAVGLGNLWRFPYVAFKNGGGAFFIPYFIALLTAGIPLMIVEYSIGQKFQGGAPKALAAVTSKFRWVGWFALLVGMTITFYYVAVMAYAWHYSVASWKVAWDKPAPSYRFDAAGGQPRLTEVDPARTVVYIRALDAEHKAREMQAQQRRRPDDRIPVYTREEVAALKAAERAKPEAERLTYVALSENVGNYFTQATLGKLRIDVWKAVRDHDPSALGERAPPGTAAAVADRQGMFRLSPNLVAGALLTWLLIFLIIYKGVHNVGKVVMITVPLPVILLLVVLLRGVTLPGATTGIIYYLKPNWQMLKDPQVWIAAYGQIFFSLSLGFGILIAYASYMPPESDVTNSAFITSFGNCATSFIAGLAVFSVLGYLAYVQGQDVQDVAAGGPGLVFVTYPLALSKMPMGHLGIAVLSFLFFLTLITLGIDSAFSIVEGVVTGFRDRFPLVSRTTMTALACAVGFAGSLLFCTRSGLMWLDIVDNWMNNYGLPFVGLMECIAVGYFFHLEELKDYINTHSEIKVHNWFDACIKVLTPAILIFLLSSQFLRDIAAPYGRYDEVLRHSVTLAGWGWFALILVAALLISRHYVAVGGVAGAGVVFLGTLAYLKAASGKPYAELVGPAGMGAIGFTLLFGGLAVCIGIAIKTHHMAGLSMEAQETPEELQDSGEEQ